MATEDFRFQIEAELQGLSKEKILYFAWLCGVRTLPSLGTEGHFGYWKKEDKQKYLYAIFDALDVNQTACIFFAIFNDDDVVYVGDKARAAYTVDDAARAAYTTVDAARAAYAVTYAFEATFITTVDAAQAAQAATYATAQAAYLKRIITTDLEKIKQAKNLKEIKLSNTDVHQLYGKVWDKFREALRQENCDYWGNLYENLFAKGLVMDEEELKALERRMNVPKEIADKGAAAVAAFLEKLEKEGAQHLNETRILILGEKGAGKTCLARRLKDPSAAMTTDDESTAGVDTSLWLLEKENMNVHIWDFAGHTITHAIHPFFLSERCLYIIVYDGRTESRNRMEYWLSQMKIYGKDSQAIILVNKRDQHKPNIPINTLKEKYPIAGIYTFSIRDDKDKLEEFRGAITSFIRNNPSWNKQQIPTSHYEVKEELEKLFYQKDTDKNTELIARKEFDAIAEKHNAGNTDELLKDLHDLGICLWYKDMKEYNTLVLNPEWISQGVYKIINWVHEKGRYAISLPEFQSVFEGHEHEIRYPQNKHAFIFDLMKQYELAYESDGKRLIIPHLLSEDRPATLPDFPVGDSLMLRYGAEQELPANTISRFMVRQYERIDTQWRYGVILTDDPKGAVALVRDEGRNINISVKGENKTEFLDCLRKDMNAILDSYKNLKPELQYRITEYGEKPEVWLQDRRIYSQAMDNEPYYEYSTKQRIYLQQTVNNYNIHAENLINGPGNIWDQSIHQTFNFQNCNFDLQGHLTDLADKLVRKGYIEEAEELTEAKEAMEKVENCQNGEEVKKSGVLNKLKRIVENLGDKDSKLHQTIEGIKYGVGIAQDIAQGYNDIAQWMGLPQVPKPFLKK